MPVICDARDVNFGRLENKVKTKLGFIIVKLTCNISITCIALSK